MTILIIHGIGGHAGIHWQQWLKGKLEQQGHTVLMPEMPNADKPDRTAWLTMVKDIALDLDPSELIIIGHSLGVTSALDYIEQLDAPIRGLVSVSGFAYDYGAELNGYFLAEKSIDFDKVFANVESAVVVYGDDDPYVTQQALANLAEELALKPAIVKKGGHINTDTGFTEFPLLLNLIEDDILAES